MSNDNIHHDPSTKRDCAKLMVICNGICLCLMLSTRAMDNTAKGTYHACHKNTMQTDDVMATIGEIMTHIYRCLSHCGLSLTHHITKAHDTATRSLPSKIGDYSSKQEGGI
jgi:hypothetical protein